MFGTRVVEIPMRRRASAREILGSMLAAVGGYVVADFVFGGFGTVGDTLTFAAAAAGGAVVGVLAFGRRVRPGRRPRRARP
jgi:membrane associated rhomboid family serine protease